MSDTSGGEQWWLASDGKWYPPETHPDNALAAPRRNGEQGKPVSARIARVAAGTTKKVAKGAWSAASSETSKKIARTTGSLAKTGAVAAGGAAVTGVAKAKQVASSERPVQIAASAGQAARTTASIAKVGADRLQRSAPIAVGIGAAGVVLIAASLFFPLYRAEVQTLSIELGAADSKFLRVLTLAFLLFATPAVLWMHRRRSIPAAISVGLLGKAAFALIMLFSSLEGVITWIGRTLHFADINVGADLAAGAYLQGVGGLMLLVAAAVVLVARLIDHLQRASSAVLSPNTRPG